MMKIGTALLVFAATASASLSAPALNVPFDFSHGEIEIAVRIKGASAHVLVDTGVDPSVVDLARAEALGLKVDRSAGGEASGFGNAKHVAMYPATIDGLAIGTRSFGPVEAGTADLAPISARYGHRLDAILGFSFLRDKTVLIDYPRRRFVIFDRAADVAPAVATCRARWSIPMRLLKGENWPLISDFRIGAASGPATLDTGSNGFVTLYSGALALTGVRKALVQTGTGASTGFRGASTVTDNVLNLPLGFGPFRLPAGSTVTLREGSSMVVANLGNALFSDMKLALLLDFRGRSLAFYGNCR